MRRHRFDRIDSRLRFAGLALLAVLTAPPARAEFHVVRTVVLGGEGRWDYLAFDGVGHRLFITRSTHVMVVDSDSFRVVGDIPDTPGVHGVALVQDLGRGFTSNGRDTSVTMFDLKTLRPLARIRVGLSPDAIVYDGASRRVFVMNAGSRSASAIDPATGTVVGTIALGGQPEEPACDGAGRMYVNLEDSSQVVRVDTRALKVLGHWSLAPGEGPSGVALDRAHGRLFSGCSNSKLVVSDVEKGSVVATLPIGARVDGAGFDPATGQAFSSNGEGTLTVVHEDSPASFRVVGNVPTALGARTLALDPGGHRIFVITAKFGETPAATPEQPRPRPSIVPGSFELLVLGE
ncbi:MAG TPA: YncE family protein [Candidatus Eisenbacteria bacterium]|jgi:YVTN family beta-propeller protein